MQLRSILGSNPYSNSMKSRLKVAFIDTVISFIKDYTLFFHLRILICTSATTNQYYTLNKLDWKSKLNLAM